MKRIILFQGGYCGDLLLGMIDKDALEPLLLSPFKKLFKGRATSVNYIIKRNRAEMKKYYNYTDKEKKNYYNNINNTIITHDTDFCLEYEKENTIQIICSNDSLLSIIAKRDYTIHKFEKESKGESIESFTRSVVGSDISDVNEYINNYSESLVGWQQIPFLYKFDIKNIGTEKFTSDVCDYFQVKDTKWAKKIYGKWLEKEKFLKFQ